MADQRFMLGHKYLSYVAYGTYFLLLVYVVQRSILLSFTHDEAVSYFILNGSSQIKNTANHHILNTFLMGICGSIFGDGELSLRLPNIIGFIFYLFFMHKIFSVCVTDRLAVFSGIAMMVLNPFVIDFFSLARGYGLSLGMMIGGIYFVIRSLNKTAENNTTDVLFSLLFSALAMFANLALINFFITIILLIAINYLFGLINKKFVFDSVFSIKTLGLIISSFFPLYYGIDRLLFLKEKGELYLGSRSLLKSLESLAESYLYSVESELLVSVILTFFGILFGFSLVQSFRSKSFLSYVSIVNIIVLLCILGLLAEHYLFGAKYPIGRTGIYFFPLIALSTAFCFDCFNISKRLLPRKLSMITCFIVLISYILHFLNSANLSYCLKWKYDSRTKEVVNRVESYRQVAIKRNKKIILNNDWLFEPAINYYIHSRGINYIQYAKRADSKNAKNILNADFTYAKNNDDIFKSRILEVEANYPEINTTLFRNKKKILFKK